MGIFLWGDSQSACHVRVMVEEKPTKHGCEVAEARSGAAGDSGHNKSKTYRRCHYKQAALCVTHQCHTLLPESEHIEYNQSAIKVPFHHYCKPASGGQKAQQHPTLWQPAKLYTLAEASRQTKMLSTTKRTTGILPSPLAQHWCSVPSTHLESGLKGSTTPCPQLAILYNPYRRKYRWNCSESPASLSRMQDLHGASCTRKIRKLSATRITHGYYREQCTKLYNIMHSSFKLQCTGTKIVVI